MTSSRPSSGSLRIVGQPQCRQATWQLQFDWWQKPQSFRLVSKPNAANINILRERKIRVEINLWKYYQAAFVYKQNSTIAFKLKNLFLINEEKISYTAAFVTNLPYQGTWPENLSFPSSEQSWETFPRDQNQTFGSQLLLLLDSWWHIRMLYSRNVNTNGAKTYYWLTHIHENELFVEFSKIVWSPCATWCLQARPEVS